MANGNDEMMAMKAKKAALGDLIKVMDEVEMEGHRSKKFKVEKCEPKPEVKVEADETEDSDVEVTEEEPSEEPSIDSKLSAFLLKRKKKD